MSKKIEISPDWIKESDACEWLGVDRSTLIKWRTSKGLHYAAINGKTVMYDRNQINALLFDNSTYKHQLKTA